MTATEAQSTGPGIRARSRTRGPWQPICAFCRFGLNHKLGFIHCHLSALLSPPALRQGLGVSSVTGKGEERLV